jgi:hypothetical protein
MHDHVADAARCWGLTRNDQSLAPVRVLYLAGAPLGLPPKLLDLQCLLAVLITATVQPTRLHFIQGRKLNHYTMLAEACE